MPVWKFREGRIFAFIDLGTNSARLLLVRLNPNRSFTVLSDQKEVVRLGEGEFDGRLVLQPEAMKRTVQVITSFVEMARLYNAEDILAVATSATREAENQAEFLRMIKHSAHIDLRVISGREEARLTYLGVANSVDLGGNQAIFIDIGGGSTEVIVGDSSQYDFLDSLKLGAIRVTSTLLTPGTETPVSPDQYEVIKEYIRNLSVRTVQRLREFKTDQAYGSSGTIENLADVAIQMFLKRPRQRDDVLTIAHLKAVMKHLCSLPLEERRQVPGINPYRADIIIAGGAILESLMETAKLKQMHVSSRGLRDGLLFDSLVLSGLTAETDSVRERSVLQLGRSCSFDEPHARHVTELALSLFDSSREIGLHKMGDWERELLTHTGMLHDIGSFLSYSNHEQHTHYLIRNADLLGFNQDEIKLMAATALFHRRALPSRGKYPEYAALDKHSRQIVKQLAIFLRIAESADRSHAGAVATAKFAGHTDGKATLEIQPRRNCELEVWGIQNHRATFKKVFGCNLQIEVVEKPPAKKTKSV
jgi:exopolyphosphatase/guanosine-5'-triphosphate,3'-diphosphate pyrophosphatase